MNWNNLKLGMCPKCGGGQTTEEEFVNCLDCDFKISKNKYFDLIKGKESEVYKKKIQKFRFIKIYNKQKENRYLKAIELQEKEKQYNLSKIQRQKI